MGFGGRELFGILALIVVISISDALWLVLLAGSLVEQLYTHKMLSGIRVHRSQWEPCHKSDFIQKDGDLNVSLLLEGRKLCVCPKFPLRLCKTPAVGLPPFTGSCPAGWQH